MSMLQEMAAGVLTRPSICGDEDNGTRTDILWNSTDAIELSQASLSASDQSRSFLVLIECAPLWILACFIWPRLRRNTEKSSVSQLTWLDASKLFFSLLLVLLLASDLCISLSSYFDGDQLMLQPLSATFSLATHCLACYLHHREYSRGVDNSRMLFIFWSISLILNTALLMPPLTWTTLSVELFSTWQNLGAGFRYLCLLAQFTLCLFAETSVQQKSAHQPKVQANVRSSFLLTGEEETNEERRQREPCLEQNASLLARLTYTWILPLLVRGYKETLTFEDLPDIMDRDRSSTVVANFQEAWQKYDIHAQDGRSERDASRTLLAILIRSTWHQFIVGGILRFVVIITDFCTPILLKAVIGVISGDDPDYKWKGILLGFAMLANMIGHAIVVHFFHKTKCSGARHIDISITSAIYRKALCLSAASRKTTTVGEIVNLMSVDTGRLSGLYHSAHDLWAAPITCITSMVFLWQIMGSSSLAGLLLLILVVPFTGYWQVSRITKLNVRHSELKDKRIRLITEVLAGIKALKLYAWENSFNKSVTDIRDEELGVKRSQAFLDVGICVSWWCLPTLVSLVVFGVHTLSSPDNYLDPTKAFVTMTVIESLNWSISFLSNWTASATQSYTSLKRITKMLRQEELSEDVLIEDLMMDEALVIEDASFSHGQEADAKPILKNINLRVDEGELIAIVGKVGSGKSSLMHAMLGELQKLSGITKFKGSVSYVSQQAWIQNETLRKNVLFGRKYQQEKYEKVVTACALKPDLEILPGGDMTEIGEKGINLSGGQKQRVSLARAVYQNNNIYFLDDPLSAVDAHVAKHLFDLVIGPNSCLRNKTRVLVTHGLTYLPHVDRIIVLVDGEISESGTYEELMDSDEGAFSEFVRQYQREESKDTQEDDIIDGGKPAVLTRQLSVMSDGHPESPDMSPSSLARTLERSDSITPRLPPSRQSSQVDENCNKKSADGERQMKDGGSSQEESKKENKERLIEEEDNKAGEVNYSVLMPIVKAWGGDILFWVACVSILFLTTQVCEGLWLSDWSDDGVPDAADAEEQQASDGQQHTLYRLTIFSLLSLFHMVMTAMFLISCQLGSLRASHVIHADLLQSVLRAPMSFFDTTPLGRIVSRFSTDIEKIDGHIPGCIRFFILCSINVLKTMFVISYSTPYFLFAVPIFVLIYGTMQHLYMHGVRQLKRIETGRRSPIYSNFDESLNGVACIRAFKQQRRFIAKNDRLLDESLIASYPVHMSGMCLGISINIVGAFIIFVAVILAVLTRDSITPGLAGLSISIAMQAGGCFGALVHIATEVENHGVSAERVEQYTTMKSEAAWDNEDSRTDAEWPQEGKVEFTDYSTRYREGLDYVIKDVTFTIKPHEKVGIVGRTGAGKSSMTLSLFRIIEPATGSITIDGVDISSLGLHDLRGKLTIIPQDPVLFSGTLRRNLDPFEVYSEEELWQALRLAHLESFVSGLKDQLNYECGENGQALSVGQRQLVCLARALLKRSRVLLLDEATAAVDLETDELIQATIRSAFKDCTVLTIAHRINTIMDYDRVLVLDSGRIKEFGAPTELVQEPASAFRSLARDAGVTC